MTDGLSQEWDSGMVCGCYSTVRGEAETSVCVRVLHHDWKLLELGSAGSEGSVGLSLL